MAIPDPREPAEPSNTAGPLRFEQVIVAVVLLAGFVFRVPWVMPAVAVLLLLALVGPATNAFTRGYDVLFPSRATAAGHPPRPAEAPGVTLITRLVETGLLALGTLFAVLGLPGFAWVFGLPVAAITGVAATTHINVVAL